jgi:MFS superfamily sulfate permease-like transporter
MSAGFIGIVTISALVAWNTYKPVRLKAVPGALIGVVAGTAVASLWKLPVRLVEIPGSLMDTVKWPSFQLLTSVDGLLSILPAALAVAFIASAESLLCASAVDQMHSGPKTKYNKELFAQGVGNAICGMLGALPMTGVIVRSAANVEAGGRTRASAILHGVWILLLVAALPSVLELIPMAALAGVLVFTGFKLVNVAAIREIARY